MTPATTTAPETELTVRDPRDGSLVGTVPAATEDEVCATVAAARAAARDWARTAPEQRGKALRAAADAVAARAEELAGLNTRETGKPFEEALGGVRAGVSTLYQYAELGPVHRGHSLRGSVLATV